jgi:hypothetical protein
MAVIAFVAGIACSTIGAHAPAHVPSFREGFWILSGDFHVHAFPGDGALAPVDLVREARRRRLNVIAISNHNQMLAVRFGPQTSLARDGVLALPGVEVTAPRAHIVAVGIQRPVDWRQPVSAIIDAIHAQGGIAIAAHPTRYYAGSFDDDAIRRLDGVEAAHPTMAVYEESRRDIEEFYDRARRLNPRIAPVGSSDFHQIRPLGLCRTYLFVRELNSSGILETLRSGRTVACDSGGRAYGNPEYVRLVQRDCEADRQQPGRGFSTALGAACALIGACALALFGGSGRADS